MALLYTDPIPREGFDTWVSPGMIAAVRPLLEDTRIDQSRRATMRSAIQRFEATNEPFYIGGKASEVRYDSIFPLPRRAAVLIGRGCVSSCEQFVLDAMHSRKVTVFGATSTGGFLDYGDVWYVTLPSGIRRLGVPSSRSRRLPHRPLDKSGIEPQVRIPPEERDPVAFAVRYLHSGSTQR